MNFENVIGSKVYHKTLFKTYGDGVICAINNEIFKVDFNGDEKDFKLDTIISECFAFENENIRNLIIEEKKKAQEAEEARKKAEEEAKKLAKKEDKNLKDREYIGERRKSGKRMVFLVCQNSTYEIEAENGYMWAPTHKDKGESEKAYHREMDFVRKGDIIFHHFDNKIYAISIAQTDCLKSAPSADHPYDGQVGRYVESKYHILTNPANTSAFKYEKIEHGSYEYGPFDKNGQNKQGFYLSELREKLAEIFIDAAIKANPGDQYLLDIQKEI